MKARRKNFILCNGMLLLLTICFTMFLSINTKAAGLEDNVTTNQGSSTTEKGYTQDDQDFANWVKNQRGVTGEQITKAGETLSPLKSAFGYFLGGVFSIIFIAVFGITALDFIFFTVPFARSILYKSSADNDGYSGASNYNSGYGGAGGGYGGGGYGGGGYGGGRGSSGGHSAGSAPKPRQWISDEAVACATMFGIIGTQQQSNGNDAPRPTGSSVLGTYFKKRVFFMILLAFSVIILSSSLLLGSGINLALWGLKLLNIINGYIPF